MSAYGDYKFNFVGEAPMLDHRHHYGYNPIRLNYREFVKATKTGRITEAKYERRQTMNGDLFTKNETDIALLRRCIEEKWIPIYEGRGNDHGDQNCSLCQHYGEDCKKCPIGEDTGEHLCHSTPYSTKWAKVAGSHDTANTPEKKLAALEEILYLERLIAKLTKVEEEEKEKRTKEALAAIQARIEKEKKTYFPHVFYITLEEPTNAATRLNIREKLATFLEKHGMKVNKEITIRYSFTGSNHLVLDTETGKWDSADISIISK